MALATSCPRCQTSFRVVPDQLKIRRGLVRCGNCQHVFSGVDSLRYLDEAPPPVGSGTARAAAGQATIEALTNLIANDPANARPPDRLAREADPHTLKVEPFTDGQPATAPELGHMASAGDPVHDHSASLAPIYPWQKNGLVEDDRSIELRPAQDFGLKSSQARDVEEVTAWTDAPQAGEGSVTDAKTFSVTFAEPIDTPTSTDLPEATDVTVQTPDDGQAIAAGFNISGLTLQPEFLPTDGDRLEGQVEPSSPAPAPAPAAAPAADPSPSLLLSDPVPRRRSDDQLETGDRWLSLEEVASNRSIDPETVFSSVSLSDPAAPDPAHPFDPESPDHLQALPAAHDSDSPVDEAGQSPADANNGSPSAAIDEAAVGQADETLAVTSEAVPTDKPDVATGAAPDAATDAAPTAAAASGLVAPQTPDAAPQNALPAPTVEPDAIDFFGPRSRSRGFSSRTNAFAMIASLLLAVTLLLQLALASRDWLAVWIPPIEPTLARLSQAAGLKVQAPRSLAALTLESFDLQAGSAPGLLNMSALVRNRANHPVRWPGIELTLTDGQGSVIVRKVLMPADYLAGGLSPKGVPAGVEQNLSVALQGIDLQPTGYNVKLFYP